MSFIVDGYNLIFAYRKHTPRLSGRQTQQLREGLIARLAAYHETTEEQVTVVFDGGGDDWSIRRYQQQGIEVIYSSGMESADDEIKRLVAAQRDPTRVMVVSSDAELRRAVGKLGAKVIRARDFNRQMREAFRRKRESEPIEPAEKFAGLSPGEVEGWLRELGFTSDEEQ